MGPKDSPLGPGSCHMGTCGPYGMLSLHLCQPTPAVLAIFKEKPEESPAPALPLPHGGKQSPPRHPDRWPQETHARHMGRHSSQCPSPTRLPWPKEHPLWLLGPLWAKALPTTEKLPTKRPEP